VNRLGSFILAAGAVLLAGSVALAADLNGKWSGEAQSKKGSTPLVLELKAEGTNLTGTMSRGKRGRGVEIRNGKIDGDSFSFTTMQKTKKGEREFEWKGTVENGEMKLSPGKGRAPAVSLKRSS
jgi:hypothetical protein